MELLTIRVGASESLAKLIEFAVSMITAETGDDLAAERVLTPNEQATILHLQPNGPPPPSTPAAPAAPPPPPAPETHATHTPPPPAAPPAPPAAPPAPAAAPPAPPAAPPAPAATTLAPAAAPPAPPAGVALDVNGLPWDGRIHASSKVKLASGAWRQKRGVDKGLVVTVTAALTAAMGAVAAPAAPPPPPAAPPIAQPAPPVPPPTAPPPPPPAAPTGTNFPDFMKAAQAASLTPEQVLAGVVANGLESTALLAVRPDLIPDVMATLGLSATPVAAA